MSRLHINMLIFFLSIAVLLIAQPTFADEIDDLKQQIEQKEEEIKLLREQAEQYQQAVGEKQDQAETLEDRIIAFNRQIRSLGSDISLNEQSISSLNLQIIRTELQIQSQEEAIIRNKEHITTLIREIAAYDDEGTVELLLKYEDFSEFYNQVAYREALNDGLKDRLEALQMLREALEDERVQLAAKKEELEKLRKTLAARKEIVEEQRAQRATLLRQTRNDEKRYSNLLAEVREKQDDVQRQIFELEDRLRRTLNPSLIPSAIAGTLLWPAEGIVSQGYGCTEFAQTSNAYPTCFHNGVDVAASMGTPIYAARDGIVIAVENASYAYGKWIAIEHDNGLITMYGHLSLQAVHKGQAVERGGVIGYMGSTGYSTGPHVHFTVYAPGSFTTQPSKISGILPIGATLDPMGYL